MRALMPSSSVSATFCPSVLPSTRRQNFSRVSWTCSASRPDEGLSLSRRAVLAGLAGAAVQLGIGHLAPAIAESKNAIAGKTPTTGYLTKSGLKYFDFQVGEGPTPKWGDMVNIKYVAYTISSSGDSLVEEDSSDGQGEAGYLLHHGNGEQIFGLEEAIHSMRTGGRRRAIIPRNIAYSNANLGPVPAADRKRRKFSKHLQEGDGTVVFDIEVLRIWPDPMDRGYYQDLTPTPEELMQIMNSDDPEWNT